MNAFFAQLPLSYSIVDKTIVVKLKNAPRNQVNVTDTSRKSTNIINGFIGGKSNEPLGGASVVEKGTQNQVLSKDDGSFSLTFRSKNPVLIVSYVGFISKDVEVTPGSPVRVNLEEVNKTMDEVVVIGYQAVKRRDLTGTVSSISGAQLEKTPVANVAEALTGRLPGVQVTTVDGQPGAEVMIRVRGGGSITGSNDPLYIVDGFRVNSINDIAITDIASIDILKDAPLQPSTVRQALMGW